MSDRSPRPQRVLPETAEALRETGDLIDVADDAMMRTIATAFQTAAAVFARLRASQGHDLLGIATDTVGELVRSRAHLRFAPSSGAAESRPTLRAGSTDQ